MSPAYKMLLATAAYLPKIPWKKGERDAFKTVRPILNDLTIPIFIVPPAGDFDHEAGKILAPAEHVKLFGKKLYESRGKRPAFIDAIYLDDERHRIDPTTHPLTALIERALIAGATAWPLTSIGRSDNYQEAVAKAHLRHQMPVAMQLSLADLQSASLNEGLVSLCNQVSCDAEDVVLIIDLGPVFVPDESQFVDNLIPILNELPRLYDWNQIVLSATALADLQKVKVNEEKVVRRREWTIYKKLAERKNEIFRLPIFSDYGVEYAKDLRPRKVRPSAKLNYTRADDYFFAKGENVKNGGYSAILPVAEKVAACSGFMGAAFSMGDAAIVEIANRRRGSGIAPTWKWAAFDHHLAMVGLPAAMLVGRVVDVPVDLVESPSTQLSLLSLLEESTQR
jgi:Beta protein